MTKELQYTLQDLKEVVHKWLYIEDDSVVDIIAAAYVANKFKTDPVWLMLVAPPSNAKTELLRAFDGHKDAFFISVMTKSTMVSGLVYKKGNDPSLLPKLNNKMVILKDFTSILSMRSEDLQEILAQLRETYDGKYDKSFGNGKVVNWRGQYGLIAACTPVYDAHHSVIAEMGERFIIYRTETTDGQKMGQRAFEIVGKEKEMRAEIKKALQRFIGQFDKLKDAHIEFSEDIKMRIVDLACFVTIGRCPVKRDYRDRCIKYDPIPEGTARLVKQLSQIAMGLVVCQSKDRVDLAVYEVIKKIARDLLPVSRLKVLRYLWDENVFEHIPAWRTTRDISESINRPSATIRLVCEDLMVSGCLNRERDSDADNAPFIWQLNNDTVETINRAELFESHTIADMVD